ncbi:MAG: nicotinamide mononucleotide transporter [Erysipelotrichaceae bacterium]|nr:nicotinamide mononucleotide transporter [Erysipelotrichaceae bacterium]
MIESIRKNMERNRTIRHMEIIAAVILLLLSLFLFLSGFKKLNACDGNVNYVGTIRMERQFEEEDYDEDSTVCDVLYTKDDLQLIVSYPYEDYIRLETEEIDAYEYVTDNGIHLCFDHQDPAYGEIIGTYKQVITEKETMRFNAATSYLILAVSLLIVLLFSGFFTLYEKCWFMGIMLLATVFAILFPEESANGVNGILIMLLYLLDIFLNILCELLISKQSRYNFLVSILVEITEILICVILRYRFATMVVTLFFWLPIDILSFINWSKHKDEKQDELTKVRKLSGSQELLVLLCIVVWTFVAGYLISGLNIQTDFFGYDRNLEKLIIYIDACASAVGMANGLFIFFRLREQWLAWYLCAFLESMINILSGQYVLLILKLGYFTNTTYGYIRWSRYIREHRSDDKTMF